MKMATALGNLQSAICNLQLAIDYRLSVIFV